MFKIKFNEQVKQNPFIYKLLRKWISIVLHVCRKTRDRNNKNYIKYLKRKSNFENTLTYNELRAFRVGEIKNWKFVRWEIRDDNEGMIYIAKYNEEKMFLDRTLFMVDEHDRDLASKNLIVIATPELKEKSLAELDLLLAIHKG